jgi:ribonuclease HI
VRKCRKLLRGSFLKVKIYSDGACWGNPGPSAIAFRILDSENRVLKEHSELIGIGTNNQAEYKALIQALKSARSFGDEVECYSDSNLIVRQMSGEWKVKHSNMRSLWREAVALKEKFRHASFIHVPRTNRNIVKVDELANLALEKDSKTLLEHERKRSQQLQLTDQFKEE